MPAWILSAFLTFASDRVGPERTCARRGDAERGKPTTDNMRMNHHLQAEIVRLGGDCADSVWRWFVLTGPHGPEFSWGQRRNQPASYVGLEHLRSVVAEQATADPTFRGRSTLVVLSALDSVIPELVRRAVQVAAALDLTDALPAIRALAQHDDPAIASDARAAGFNLSRMHRDGA